ncbi:MAG: DUF1800 domain-containing protein [Planctomycetota bacterium]
MLFQTTTGASVGPRQEIAPARRDDVRTLLHRATFGFTANEFERASSMGYRAWLDEQLDPASIDDSALDARLAGYPTLAMDAETLVATYPQSSGGDVFVAQQLISARIVRAVESRRQLFERVVEFWTDHFNIDGTDGPLRYFKTVDDREVIRRYALGSFRDLLSASTRSAAMLYYLDNYVNSAGAPNENYARELMELHTLGVDGGYTEDDVKEVARCFTGWTFRPAGVPGLGAFLFRPLTHDSGAKTVLGTSLPAGGGIQDGETVIDLLASHPSTAQFLARKLCVYFLTYEPPQVTVDRVAARFTATGGSIAATVREVLATRSYREARIDEYPRLRRPFHMAVGALRSTGATLGNPAPLRGELFLLGHTPFTWPAPNGYPDSLGAWGSNLLPRWSFMSKFFDGQVTGSGISTSALFALIGGVAPAEVAATLDQRLTGGRMSAVDVAEVQGFVDSQPSWNGSVARQAVALALSVPSTQFH